MLNYAAKLGPRSRYRFFAVAPDASEAARRSPRMPVREPAYMHSFGLTERWLVLAEFPFVVNPLRSRSRAAPTSRTTAGSPSWAPASRWSTARTGEVDGRVRDRRLLRLPPRQRLRGRRTRSSSTSAPSRTPSIDRGPLPRAAARRASPSSDRELTRFRLRPWPTHGQPRAPGRGRDRAAADQLRPPQRAPLPLRVGQSARRQAAGSSGSSRSTSATAPRCPGREPRLLSRRAGVRRRARRPRARTTACCSRSCSTPRRQLVPARARRRRPERAGARARCPTTSRSASTGSSPAPERSSARTPLAPGGGTDKLRAMRRRCLRC